MFVFTDPTSSGDPRRPSRAEHRRQRLHLDRIAERGAGAVRFDVLHRRRLDAALREARRRMSASCAGPFGAVSPLLRPS